MRGKWLAAVLGTMFLSLAAVHANEPIRVAPLVHGELTTSRQAATPGGSRRLLMSEGGGWSKNKQVWVIGLAEDAQDEVLTTLTDAEGHVMHPLPGGDDHHWLVSANAIAISQLLESYPDLTVALLSPDLKKSPAVHALIKEVEDQEAQGGCQAKGERVLLTALMPTAAGEEILEAVEAAKRDLSPQVAAGAGGEQAKTDCALDVSATQSVLRISVCKKDSPDVASWMASLPQVTWVDLFQRMRRQNLPNNAAIQAPSTVKSATLPTNLAQGLNNGLFPFWKAGLDGKGQVVGVVDSGVDMDSCFFYDPKSTNYLEGTSTTTLPEIPFTKGSYPNYVSGAMRANLGGRRVFENPQHRKIVQYVMWSGDRDSSGHGTHVAGTIAGAAYGFNSLTNPNLATGIAPGAKLAIFDVGYHSFDEGFEAFDDADPGQFYEIQRKAGARITANSWGSSAHSYSAPMCFMLDAYAWKTQDTLHVFAAGNSGDRLDLLTTTGSTVAPGSCKNVLSVGATESWVDEKLMETPVNLVDASNKPVSLGTSTFKAPTFKVDRKISFVAGDNAWKRSLVNYGISNPDSYMFMTGSSSDTPAERAAEQDSEQGAPNMSFKSGIDPLKSKKTIKVVAANPSNACKPLVGNYKSSDPTVAIVVFVRNSFTAGCSGDKALANVVAAGADGLVMFWDEQDFGLIRSGATAFRGKTFPAFTVHPLLGWQLGSTLDDGGSVFMKLEQVPASPVPVENVAWFSSFGSAGEYADEPNGDFTALDVRVKPDLVAPGYALSADSDGDYTGGASDKCAAKVRVGTSTAAPIVAGSAAIVRQYFTQGFYPSGKASTSVHNPSAPLVKAVLLAGTAAMKGISRVNGELLAPPPSPFQGFGRLDLSSSLPLAGDAKGWELQVVDGATFTKEGQEHKYTVTVPAGLPAGQPLVLTLVYHDFPGFPGSKYVLVNDLDLVVKRPNGKLLWGNGREGGDYHNNVEKIYIAKPEAGKYTISVRSSYLFIGARPQSYALVALGGFTGTLDSKFNPLGSLRA